ncbi:MAG: IclR family transcriptional regulator [Myxococcota bacterium]|nr:IclR family transcriptional regulator [Myxococcota bacterium]
MKRPKSEYAIQTVTNALRLLESFRDREELGVTELSRSLDLHKNNVFRLLATLEEKGYVEQCAGNERYRLGVCCLELGFSFTRHRNLARHARGALESLARETGETAHIGSLAGHEVIHLDGEASPHMVASRLRLGTRLAPHATALGKVLLGFAPPPLRERFDERCMSKGLESYTDATITDRDKLLDHLGAVAGQGWALDLEELEPGLSCAAAPVHDAAGSVVAALSVSGPTSRLGETELIQGVLPLVQETAAALSRDLGYVAPDAS